MGLEKSGTVPEDAEKDGEAKSAATKGSNMWIKEYKTKSPTRQSKDMAVNKVKNSFLAFSSPNFKNCYWNTVETC